MARIRTIKPEFPQSESMGSISRDARLTFVLLWTIADDAGRARGSSRMLASLLYPYDDDAPQLIDGWLAELERENCVVRYIADGAQYLQIRNWLIHQKIDKPSTSKIPPPREDSRGFASESRTFVGGSGSGSGSGPGSGPGPGSTTAHTQTVEKPREDSRDKATSAVKTPPSTSARTGARKGKAPEPAWFAEFKAAYPKRAGDQGWTRALKAANARMAEGHQPGEFIAGAQRYADYCKADGSVGTQYVKQAASFLGPDKHFDQAWAPPAARQKPPVTATKSAFDPTKLLRDFDAGLCDEDGVYFAQGASA